MSFARLLIVGLVAAPPAFAGSLEVCGDAEVPAAQAAHHCRLALERGKLTDRQAFAAQVNLGYALLDLTLFGQMVVLTLIQAGGLGIMTLSTAILLMARKRPSLAVSRLFRTPSRTAGIEAFLLF